VKDAVVVEGLTKHYDGLQALDQVTFTVDEGTVFGLLGPNGAGKTTTIRILTGLSRPSGGRARVMGFDMAREAVEAKRITGVVPDASNVYEELTAHQNLVFAAQLYGVPRAQWRPRAEELLHTFGLADRAASRVAGFSHGMKRRLTIACALVHGPQLLFLDEPTTGLDVQSARQLRGMVGGLREEGVTVFLTTHYIEEADQLCDRVAMINKGRIVALDTPEALKASVTGSTVVEVAFSGNPDEDELRAIPGVLDAHRLGDRYRLTAGNESDVISAVVDYGRGRGLKITSLTTLKTSLEDAFLRITGSTPTPKNDGPEGVRRTGS
jgi:ABC-2 type transport system ATP-binding protein